MQTSWSKGRLERTWQIKSRGKQPVIRDSVNAVKSRRNRSEKIFCESNRNFHTRNNRCSYSFNLLFESVGVEFKT